MKKLVVLLMAMLVAASASAIVDPDTNMMGIYFDQDTADEVCLEGVQPSYTAMNAYLLLVNPDFESIKGFECSVHIEGPIFPQEVVLPEGSLRVGEGDSYSVGFATPSPALPVHLLATFPFAVTATTPAITFDIGPSVPSSNTLGLPMVIAINGSEPPVLVTTGFTTIDGGYVAAINGGCGVVATESLSFDGIKSLYR